MISNVADTSREALRGLSLPGQKTQADDVFLVVQLACRAGTKDLSLREIRQAYVGRFERDIDVSTVSARVNNLVTAQRLIRATVPRPCSLSGKSVLPVSVPAKQAPIVY